MVKAGKWKSPDTTAVRWGQEVWQCSYSAGMTERQFLASHKFDFENECVRS